MKTTTKLGLVAAFAAMTAAPAALAKDDAAPGQMMQEGGMMGGDMSDMQDMKGMMQMMQMMQTMRPMMETCTEMMQQMTHHQPGHDGEMTPPVGPDATPAPQGG